MTRNVDLARDLVGGGAGVGALGVEGGAHVDGAAAAPDGAAYGLGAAGSTRGRGVGQPGAARGVPPVSSVMDPLCQR
ncbi:MAG: hypothetical protein ACT4OX_02420 [Actinomycetota bacterium]